MRGHYRNSDDKKARLTIILPVEVDEQLRRLAAQRGTAVNPIVRDWIIEKLREVRISPGKTSPPRVAG
jgi:hypothetical protein